MLFGSFEFLLGFLPVTFTVYHALRLSGRAAAAKWFMAAASIVFYGWWNIRGVPLVVASVGANFLLSLWMTRGEQPRRPILISGIVLNLGLLGYFKYTNFFVSTLNSVSGFDVIMTKVGLPLAISFFTFQQIAYLVEAYRSKRPAESFIDYALFVLFFPHLIAGPITHHLEMLPQFKSMGRKALPVSYLSVGLSLLVLGLAKKAVIADTLSEVCNPAFHAADAGYAISLGAAWLGSLAYTFQLYFDFSGYSDMAVGLGLLFGIRMPVNFASPYRSLSIIDFWRRWHISLSRFLRNYLYIPLGGNRSGQFRRHMNLFITMALGGLWHGAGWTFLAWGALHGAYLIINHFWRARFGEARTLPTKALAWLLTFLAVVVAWVLFRSVTFDGAVRILAAMAAHPTGRAGADIATSVPAWLAVLAAGLVAVASPSALELVRYPHSTPGEPVEGAPLLHPVTWRLPSLAGALSLGVIAAFAIARLPDPGVFLYFNF